MNTKWINYVPHVAMVVLVVLIVLNWKQCSQKNKFRAFKSLYEKLNGDFENLENQFQTVKSENINYLLELESSDSTINALQDKIVEYRDELSRGGRVTYVERIVEVEVPVPTTVIRYDTIWGGNDTMRMPVYGGYLDLDGWITGSIVARWDTIFPYLKVHDSYFLVFGTERRKVPGSLFKQRVPVVKVDSENPYVTSNDVKDFQIEQFPSGWGLGFGIGLSAGLQLDGTPYVGGGILVGLQKNLIQFRRMGQRVKRRNR